LKGGYPGGNNDWGEDFEGGWMLGGRRIWMSGDPVAKMAGGEKRGEVG